MILIAQKNGTMYTIGLKEVRRVVDRGRLIVNYIGCNENLREALFNLIHIVPPNTELSIIEVSFAECYHEVRVTNSGIELKRGCHGAYGTWKACTESEAVEWLLPGLEHVTKNPRLGALTLSMKVDQ